MNTGQPPGPSPVAEEGTDGRIRRQLLAPGVALAAAGIVTCVQFLAPLVAPHLDPFAWIDPGWRSWLRLLSLGPVVGLVILLGAVQMLRLETLLLARTACLLAMLPCSLGWLVGLPAGAWALAVLDRPGVTAAFRARAARKAAAYRETMDRAAEEIDADLREPPGSPWADI